MLSAAAPRPTLTLLSSSFRLQSHAPTMVLSKVQQLSQTPVRSSPPLLHQGLRQAELRFPPTPCSVGCSPHSILKQLLPSITSIVCRTNNWVLLLFQATQEPVCAHNVACQTMVVEFRCSMWWSVHTIHMVAVPVYSTKKHGSLHQLLRLPPSLSCHAPLSSMRLLLATTLSISHKLLLRLS